MLRKSLPLGQPSINPVLMIRMQIVGYALLSGRLLCREMQVNFANRHAPIVRYLWPHKLLRAGYREDSVFPSLNRAD
jgi:hypothetical protein